MKNILVIAPHPDDEVLGCGGTIAKLANDGAEVNVLVMTMGDPKFYDSKKIKNVRREAELSHQILGVKKTFFKDFHAPNLDKYELSEIANAIKSIISSVKPDRIYIPHRGDIHNDHAIIFKASLVAARPVDDYTVKEILCYETLSETEWAAPFGDDVFIPTVFEDVKDTFALKLEAMNCFKSQIKKFPNPRSLENLTALASYRGATVGFERAESFSLVRQIN